MAILIMANPFGLRQNPDLSTCYHVIIEQKTQNRSSTVYKYPKMGIAYR